MSKEIQGIVQHNPVVLEQCCIFAVEDENGSYLVISTDRQAGKDNIFVEQGQEICIHGSAMEDRRFQGVVVTEQAKIVIGQQGK